MFHFTVDSHQVTNDGCFVCCCERLSLVPGTTSKVSIVYAPWVLQIGTLHCEPQFVLQELETCRTLAGPNLPPQPQQDMARFYTNIDSELTDDLKPKIVDPEGDPLVF